MGQFNINNLEWTKAVLQTANEQRSPVILGVSEGAGKYMCGYKTVTNMVNGMLDELNILFRVALHLDHGSYEGAKACIAAGFIHHVRRFSSAFDETSKKQKNWLKSAAARAYPWKQKSAPSAVKKTALSEPATSLILKNVKKLLI